MNLMDSLFRTLRAMEVPEECVFKFTWHSLSDGSLLTLRHMCTLNNIPDFNQWEPEGVPEQRLRSVYNEHSARVPCGAGEFGGKWEKADRFSKRVGESRAVWKAAFLFSVGGLRPFMSNQDAFHSQKCFWPKWKLYSRTAAGKSSWSGVWGGL